MEGAKIYVPDKDVPWVRATVVRNVSESSVEVKVEGIMEEDEPRVGPDPDIHARLLAEELRVVDLKSPDVVAACSRGGAATGAVAVLPLQNVMETEAGVADMCSLNYLHEPAILFNLRRRFFARLPYTYTGDICIAVNPYRWLDIYTDDLRLVAL
jgi:myosin-5